MAMLLPSPFPCDARKPSLQQFARCTGRSRSHSPAPDPSTRSSGFFLMNSRQSTSIIEGGINNTCRALHSLLGLQTPYTTAPRVQTPLRQNPLHSNARVVKRPPLPPREVKKRRRDTFEDEGPDWPCDRSGKRKQIAIGDSTAERFSNSTAAAEDQENLLNLPSTPKRQCRRAPTHIPFGLERADFYDLCTTPLVARETTSAFGLDTPMGSDEHDDTTPRAFPQTPVQICSSSCFEAFSGSDSQAPESCTPRLDAVFKIESTTGDEDEGHNWSEEDDRQLVELVLAKLQLSRRAWNECARQLGADQHSLGARWRFLLDEGQVGLKLRKGGKRTRGPVKGLWT